MPPAPSRRSVLAFLGASTAGTIVAIITLTDDGNNETTSEGDGDSETTPVETANNGGSGRGSEEQEIEETLVIESNEQHTIESGTGESYQAVEWRNNGKLHFEDSATLELISAQ